MATVIIWCQVCYLLVQWSLLWALQDVPIVVQYCEPFSFAFWWILGSASTTQPSVFQDKVRVSIHVAWEDTLYIIHNIQHAILHTIESVSFLVRIAKEVSLPALCILWFAPLPLTLKSAACSNPACLGIRLGIPRHVSSHARHMSGDAHARACPVICRGVTNPMPRNASLLPRLKSKVFILKPRVQGNGANQCILASYMRHT